MRRGALALVATAVLVVGGTVTVATPAFAAPTNDDFANAQSIGGASACVVGDNTGATYENNEFSDYFDGTSVWYTWTAPSSGTATIRIWLRTLVDSTLTVSTGDAPEFPDVVTGNDDTYDLASYVSFAATSGTTYNIRLAGYSSDEGTFALDLNDGCTPPANDDFADATPATGATGSLTGQTNEAATGEADENNDGSTCTDDSCSVHTDLGGSSVWYSWAAPSSGTIDFCVDTADAGDFYPRIVVYTGSLGSLTQVVAGQGDAGTACTETVASFDADSGTTYMIGVGGRWGSTGPFDLAWGDHSRPTVTAALGSGQSTPTNASPVTFDVAFSEPVTGFDENDVNLSEGSATTGMVTVTDTGDQMNFTVDVEVTGDGSVVISIPADSAADAANNNNRASGEASLVFDASAPSFGGGISYRIQGAKVTATFFASDNAAVTYLCHIDGASDASCSSPLVFQSPSGSHTLYVTATDAAGNDGHADVTFTVKSKRIKP
jgi:hypothetical protein